MQHEDIKAVRHVKIVAMKAAIKVPRLRGPRG